MQIDSGNWWLTWNCATASKNWYYYFAWQEKSLNQYLNIFCNIFFQIHEMEEYAPEFYKHTFLMVNKKYEDDEPHEKITNVKN